MIPLRQSGAGWPALAALAIALLFACVTRESEEAGWSGVIRNACGPAGGNNAMEIRIVGNAAAACGDFTAPDTASDVHSLYLPDILIDSLRPGVVLRDTVDRILPPDFLPINDKVLAFSVETVSPERVRGHLEVQKYRDGLPATPTRHEVALAVCPRYSGPCF